MKSVPLSSNIPSISSSRNIASPPISISKASKRSLSPVSKHQTKIVVTQKTAPGRTLPKKPPILEKRKFVVKPPVKPKPSNVPANGHNVEAVEDIPVVSQPSSQYIGTDSSSTPKKVDTCSVELQQILKENSHQMHTSDEQVIGDDGVAILRPDTESQHVIPDELLLILNLVKSIIIYPTRCINDTTPVPNQRNRKLSRWNFSPFTIKFRSSSGTSTSASCDSPILNKQHPFTPFIGYRYDPCIENKYLKWIKEGLLTTHERKKDNEDHFRKHKSDILISLQFGVELLSYKNWFYKLSFSGQLLNDVHINVIFYYLRKKGKYSPPRIAVFMLLLMRSFSLVVKVCQIRNLILRYSAPDVLLCFGIMVEKKSEAMSDYEAPAKMHRPVTDWDSRKDVTIFIVAVTKSGNIQSHFGKSESSGKAVVVHGPYKGLDLFGYSKMPDPNGGDITSEGMLFQVDNMMVGPGALLVLKEKIVLLTSSKKGIACKRSWLRKMMDPKIMPSATVIYEGIDSISSSPIEGESIKEPIVRVSFQNLGNSRFELPEFSLQGENMVELLQENFF
ncbi:hypothetical protein BC332_21045 [Capsicum chinense]|nr:hypothetical protein BC332_21045 [Capsicum chinense]